MAYHDVQLPTDVERGAVGGPGFSTTVISLSSGFEQRNINWANSRGEWDISYGIQTKEDFTAVIDFFYARQGKAHSFRFKDWTDFEIGDATAQTGRQQIGTGDASTTAFQIFKRYTSGSINFDRDITKPISGTLTVWENSVIQTEGVDYTVDYSTGIITFTGAPASSVAIEVTCEFDVPVRFDTDRLDVSAVTFDAGSIPSIQIVEVRGE